MPILAKGTEDVSNYNNIYLNVIKFMSNNMDTILNISLLISCIILYINIPKVIIIFMEKKENKEVIIEKWTKKFKSIYWFLFILIFSFFLFDYNYPELFPLNTTSYISRRTLKFILAILLNISNLYINIKTNGFKSWKTLFSIFSLFSTLFFVALFFSDDLRWCIRQSLLRLIQWGLVLKAIGELMILNKQYIVIFWGQSNVISPIVAPDKTNVMMSKYQSDQEIKSNKGHNNRSTIRHQNQGHQGYRIEKKNNDLYNIRKERIRERRKEYRLREIKERYEKKKNGILLRKNDVIYLKNDWENIN